MLGFFAVFFIGAPLLVLYASGYRYDFKRHSIVRTGTLFLETTATTDADIYINDALYESTLRKKIYIYNLLPGTYRIRLEKNGFHPWSGEVGIASSVTSFVKDIVLFPRSEPGIIDSGSVAALAAAHESPAVAYVTASANGAALRISRSTEPAPLTGAGGRVAELKRFDSGAVISRLQWSAHDRYLAVQRADELVILSAGEPFTETRIALRADELWAWDGSADDRMFIVSGRSITAVDSTSGVRTQAAQLPAGESVSGAPVASGRSLYFATVTSGQTNVREYNTLIKTLSLVTATKRLEDAAVLSVSHNTVILSQPSRQRLTIIRLSAPSVTSPVPVQQSTDIQASDAAWSGAGDRILAADYGEVSVIDAADFKKSLLARYGSPIRAMAFVQKTPSIVLVTSDGILVHDLASTRAPLILASGAAIDAAAIAADQSRIYFTGTVDGAPGIYSIPLTSR